MVFNVLVILKFVKVILLSMSINQKNNQEIWCSAEASNPKQIK